MSLLRPDVDLRPVVEDAMRLGAASTDILPQTSLDILTPQARDSFATRKFTGPIRKLTKEFQSLIDEQVNPESSRPQKFNYFELFRYSPFKHYSWHIDERDLRLTAIFTFFGEGSFEIKESEFSKSTFVDNRPGRVILLRQGQQHYPGPARSERYSFAMRQRFGVGKHPGLHFAGVW